MLKKVHEDILSRVARRVLVVEGCPLIQIFVEPFSQVEQTEVAFELLKLRKLADAMVSILEAYNVEQELITAYRSEYPRKEDNG